MSENQNKQIARRQFLEFTGKTMVVAGLGAITTLSKYVNPATACCSSDCPCYVVDCPCEGDIGSCIPYEPPNCPCNLVNCPCQCDPIDCPCQCDPVNCPCESDNP